MKMTDEEILLLKELTEKAMLAEREEFRLLLLKALKEKISDLENNNFSTHNISTFTMPGGTEITIKLLVPNEQINQPASAGRK